jgi:hypothetical protein
MPKTREGAFSCAFVIFVSWWFIVPDLCSSGRAPATLDSSSLNLAEDLDGAVTYIVVDKKPARHAIGYVRAELQLFPYKTSKISTSFVGTDDV